MNDFELSCEEPVFLLALCLIPLFILLDWLYLRRVHTAVRRTGLILRCAALLCAVCMLAGLTLHTVHAPVDLVILSDVSASMDPNAVSALTETLTENAQGVDTVHCVRFAGSIIRDDVEASPNALSATNLRAALEEGTRFYQDGRRLHLMLLTDGLETEGNLRREAARQADIPGIRMDAVWLPASEETPEAQISSVTAPGAVFLGENCDITVCCASRSRQTANLRLMSGNVVLQQKKMTLNRGETVFSFRIQPDTEGTQLFRIQLIPSQDTVSANNVWDVCIEVRRERRVLLIVGGQSDPGPLLETLAEMDVKVHVLPEKNAPLTAAETGSHCLIILMDVDAQNMPPASLRNLSDYVNVYGGSVLTLGGAHTYGYGHMADTALEKMLPVRMQAPDSGRETATALLIMIDNSASMAEARSHLANATDNSINMAKLGAIACVQALTDRDWIGVISFSDKAKVVSPMVPALDRESVISAITKMGTLNGTNYTEALETALEAMDGISGVSEKHVMFISDGSPGDEGYMDTVRRMREHGIVLSTIGIGEDIYQDVLTSMAAAGGGHYSAVSAGDDLVKQMLWDASLYQTAYTVTEKVDPVDTTGAFSAVPELEGYVRVTPRTTGTVLLSTPGGDPIYAVWSYGKGRAAAFMSDLEGIWSHAWLESSSGRGIIQQMMSGLMPENAVQVSSSVQLILEGEVCLLTAQLDGLEEDATVTAQVQQPSGQIQEVTMKHMNGGYWQAECRSGGAGVYQITLRLHHPQSVETTEISGTAVTRWPDEYNMFPDQDRALSLLNDVCQQLGGEVLDAHSTLEGDRMEHVHAIVSLRPYLALLTVLLICTEILLRRRTTLKKHMQ